MGWKEEEMTCVMSMGAHKKECHLSACAEAVIPSYSMIILLNVCLELLCWVINLLRLLEGRTR